jgi:hypothetical protein
MASCCYHTNTDATLVQGGHVVSHLLAQLCFFIEPSVGQSLVQVTTKARLEHEINVGSIIRCAAQLNDAWHTAGAGKDAPSVSCGQRQHRLQHDIPLTGDVAAQPAEG